jgi:hypothetical protein
VKVHDGITLAMISAHLVEAGGWLLTQVSHSEALIDGCLNDRGGIRNDRYWDKEVSVVIVR